MEVEVFVWEFPKIGVPCFGVLIIRILLFRVLYQGPQFSETPIYRGDGLVLFAYFGRNVLGGIVCAE